MSVHESDVCIIGAGITSAMLAQKLSELRPGLSITVVEAGRSIFDLENRFRYREQMLKYEQNPWPEDFIPEPMGRGTSISRTMAVGGQALHWGGTCNRFSENICGCIRCMGCMWTGLLNGPTWKSTIAMPSAGWVFADARPVPRRPSVNAPYPMPPMELSYDLAEFEKHWGEKSGYPFQGIPQSKNTVPYDGRSQCFRCGTCEICPTGQSTLRISPSKSF